MRLAQFDLWKPPKNADESNECDDSSGLFEACRSAYLSLGRASS